MKNTSEDPNGDVRPNEIVQRGSRVVGVHGDGIGAGALSVSTLLHTRCFDLSVRPAKVERPSACWDIY